ncbi:MAG: hypothetical protein ACRDQ4_21365 [Pseudonocardiaceae bacterium]
MPIEEVAVELGWDPAKLSGTWVPDTAERDVSWARAQIAAQISGATTQVLPSLSPADHRSDLIESLSDALFIVETGE